ncbi:MAG: hypothetical protein V3T74_02145, partial [Gemmatimonadales bacterium]
MPGCSDRLLALACLWLVLSGTPQEARAQIISPGKLSEAHGHLEGMKNCTNCHELRKPGINSDRCLGCHEPLQKQLGRGRGFHAGVADRNCAACHKEHFGRDFDLLRFDTNGFDHDDAGFELVESHAAAGCRDCHSPALVSDPGVRVFKARHDALVRTFLGLGTTCLSCHRRDDPHGEQFSGRECHDCHTQSAWEKAELFDHNRTRYRLTGLHRRAACEDCHKPLASPSGAHDLQYVGLAFRGCASCHRDVHRGAMDRACSGCHTTRGWHRINRSTFEGQFDHNSTDFRLIGAHAEIECDACHGSSPAADEWLRIRFAARTRDYTYPVPVAADCLSCHRDYHERAFEDTPGGTLCENCHSQRKWMPTSYDIERHNRETEFALTGAHLAAPCFRCHENTELGRESSEYRFTSTDCASCHRGDDPHGTQFEADPCTECHDTASFEIAVFDHDATRYPLDGAH